MNTQTATLTFDTTGMEWDLYNPAWEHTVTFLTYEATLEYCARNGVVVVGAQE